MKRTAKKMFQELIENIDFPIMIYSGRSGNVIASNTRAANILGHDLKNIKSVIDGSTSVGLSKSILSFGRKTFYNLNIYNGTEYFEIDAELNCLLIDNEYIMFCFFDRSYKQVFQKSISKIVPRFFFKDTLHTFRSASLYFVQDTNVILDGTSSNQVFMDKDTSEYFMGVERDCMKNKKGIYNIIHNINGLIEKECYIKMNMIPLYSRTGDCLGVMGIYTLLLTQSEYKMLFNATLYENQLLNRLISKAEIYVVSWIMGDGWPIEYVSSNFVQFGYTLNDLYSGNIKWQDLIHPDDIDMVTESLEDLMKKKKSSFPTITYRLRKSSGRYTWVSDETYALSNIGDEWRRDGVLREVQGRELKK